MMETAAKHPHNPIADTPARNIRDTHTLWQRSLVAIALLVTCVLGVKAEEYVLYYDNGTTKYYMANVNNTLTVLTDENYDASTCVWVGTSGGKFSNNGKEIYLTYSSPSLKDAGAGSDLIIEDGTNNIYRNINSTKVYIIYNATSANRLNFSFSNKSTNIKAATPPATTPEPESITITPNNLSLSVGETATVTYTIAPDGAYDEDVRFSIDKDAIASINTTTGVVTAIAAGNATLTITAHDSKGGEACSATCAITVQDNGPQFVDEAGVAAAKANIVVGVGYPKTTSEAYINLNNLTANTKTQAEVNALITAYKTCADIMLPEDGKAYTFTALFKDGKKYNMHYENGVKVKVSDEVTASTFVCVELRTNNPNEKVYAFVTEDGHILTWIGNDEGGAYKENGNIYGYSSEYATEYNGQSDWNEITVKKNDTHEEQFGLLRLVGRRHSTATSAIIANTNKRFDQAADGNWFNSDNTSGWIVTEATYPTGNTDVEYAIAQIRAKEAEKYKTPAPKFVVDVKNKCFYLNCTEQEGTIYYTTDGSDPTDPANNPTALTAGQSMAFTSGTIKAYAHKDGYTPSDVVEQLAEIVEIDTAEELAAITGNGYYIVTADITVTSHTSITNFTGVLDGGFHTISGLNAPLFANTDGAVIKNVTLKDVNISGTGSAGAIATTATGATRIYNCGVLSGNISGTSNVGSIAGKLNDEARVINCYSFANITGGTTVGGIVGYNSVASNAGNLKTLVMNCMFYGDITGGTSVSPIYGGQKISNAGANGINNYNYYRHEAKITPTAYNCALAAEESYLTRFEFYRHVLNSQRKLCAFYVTGSVDNYEEIAKWVLDVSGTDAPKYPILKPWGKYASMMNRATTDRKVSTLAVTIEGTNAKGDPISATTTLNITNADPTTYDYNHYKVQLPYYNDHFTDNYTNNKVVTGWKITSITGGTAGTFSTTGDDRYNFADRYCTQKDLYGVSGRVFAQGGYYNVPEGVTAITIEPYWGNAVYLSDAGYDVVYTTGYAGYSFQPTGLGSTPGTFNGQTVYKSMSNVWSNLQSGGTVFDNAIVLVGNYHSYNETWENSSGGKPFTFMSVDIDKDNEPDYGLYFKTSVRVWINPVRFDFINHVALGMAAKVEGNSTMPNIAIFRPKGWFEITETALAIYEEFEYDWHDTGKALAPLILNGGIFNQFCSINVDGETVYKANRTQYTIVGGNSYFKNYTPGCQSGEVSSTAFPPVSILGGEYENFYLSGLQAQATPIKGHNALCYGNGGKIGMFAGACQEAIDGDVIIKLDHMLIDEFYGGGINDKKPITGNINVTINNSQVGIYCGGPKFGNMATGKAITTYAENTTFGRADEPISGRFFGAGYGGTSLYRYRVKDVQNQTTYDQSWFSNYTGDRGEYYNTGGDDRGIMVSYETEHFCYAGGGNVNARFFTNYASLSVAEVKNVTTTLKGCTINGDLYGGGNLGKASGNISTTLENCIVKGSSYAAGFSAAVPTCEVMPTTPPTYSTYNGNTGIFTPVKYPQPEIFTWAQADAALVHGQVYINDTKKEIYTKAVDLSDLGTVRGNTTIEIKGDNSHIYGSVFGGGNASKVIGNTYVHIQGGTIDGNVFGAGNEAEVDGKTEVIIGEQQANP